MDEAAPQPAGTGAGQDALAALRFSRGGAYRAGWDVTHRWRARRPDGLGGGITAPGPGEPRRAAGPGSGPRPVSRGWPPPPAQT